MGRLIRIGIITVLIAIIVVWGGGLMLPVDHVARVRAEYSVSGDSLFAVISDISGHASWRSGVDSIVIDAGTDTQPRRWREFGSSGTLPMSMTLRQPPNRMITTIVADDLPFGGRWLFDVTPGDGVATLEITEEGEVYNAAFRFIGKFIIGHHRTATTFLEDLGRRFGETVRVDRIDMN